MSSAPSGRPADDLVRRLAAARRGAQLYAPGHPLVERAIAGLTEALTLALSHQSSIAIGIVGDDLVVGDTPVPRAAGTMGELMRRLRQAGIERIVVDRGVQQQEIAQLIAGVARGDARDGTRDDARDGARDDTQFARLPHIRVGRLQVDTRVESVGDMATFRRLYDDASAVAGRLWDSALTEGKPDADAANGLVDSLAQAVAQNRTALLALTALKNYDNYTFTHMVNVSILAMGQARGVGIEGALLREIGLAGLMHDIGKVRVPSDILNKPGKLTDGEYAILQRHTTDGAQILKTTPEIPTLAPIVAFEHHLRSDGTGYPATVARPRLNLATALCGIADVYDAMRSQRVYQQASPTDRILVVLQRNDGKQFDQHLVRRFVQLVGIYPVGNLVRLDTGEIAVVTRSHAPDPHRPRVKVVIGADGETLERPYDVSLWAAGEGEPTSVSAPVDPTTVALDALSYL